jgi:hypothetical protein
MLWLRCFLLTLMSLQLLGCGPKPIEVVDYEDLTWKDDLFMWEGRPFTGLALANHPNGRAKASYPLRDGKLHGRVQEWWDNGKLSTETHFENGKRHGSNNYWSREGQWIKQQQYRHDQSISETHFPQASSPAPKP